jgi:MFS family permease
MLPRKLQILLISMFLYSLAANLFAPFLALYIKELGADVGQVGVYFTVMLMVQAVFRIVGGWVSDNVGRVQTAAFGSLFGVAGLMTMWLAPTWEWLIPGGVVMNVGIALVGTTYLAYIAECVDASKRSQVFGFTDSIFFACQIVGAPLGGYLAQLYGYRQLFAVALGLMTVVMVLRLWNAWGLVLRLDRLKPASLKRGLSGIGALVLAGGLLAWILFVDVIRDFGVCLSWELFPLYQRDVGGLVEGQIGWLTAMGTVAAALLMTPVGRLSDRIGERKVMSMGALLHAAGLLLFVHVRSFVGYAFAMMLIRSNWPFYGPPFQSLLSKSVPSNQLGLAYGIFISTVSLSSMFAPAVGAQLWEGVSPQFPAYLTFVSLLVTLPFIWVTFKPPARASVAADQAPATSGSS